MDSRAGCNHIRPPWPCSAGHETGYRAGRGRGGALRRGPPGPYQVQAAIAACHATARTYEDTDWESIVALYDALLALTPSAVIELNRAVAMGKANGPQAGLDALAQLMEEPALDTYHLLPAVRADLLAQLGRVDDARAELDRAIRLATNDAEIEMLRARADALTRRV